MQCLLRDVDGSEAARDTLRYQFVALRIWSGCSLLFFTLNPHDHHSPLLIYCIGEREECLEKVL